MTEKATGKRWWTSRTIWVQVVALAAMLVQERTGWVVKPEYQMMALLAINAALRAITKTSIEWPSGASTAGTAAD